MKRRPLQRRRKTALQDRAYSRLQPASARLRKPLPHALGRAPAARHGCVHAHGGGHASGVILNLVYVECDPLPQCSLSPATG